MSAKSSKKQLKNKKSDKESHDESNKSVGKYASTKSDHYLDSVNPAPKSDKKLSTSEQLEMYLNNLKDEDLSKLSADKILEIRKKLNPYGRTIAGSDKYLNFSITQISHEYYKKLIITSFIGYLNRMCDEWKVPNGIPVTPVYDFIDDKTKLDTPKAVLDKNDTSAIYDYEFNRKWMEKRVIVREFLEEMFQFNPDEHVRSAYRPNYKDPQRDPLKTMAAKIAVNHLVKQDASFRNEKKQYDESQGKEYVKVKKVIVGKDGQKKTIYRDVPVKEDEVVKPKPHSGKKLEETGSKDDIVMDTVTNYIPPHDIFGRFKMYLNENYEELREAVMLLYCEKPDLELAINPYSWHDTKEEAEQFKKQHADEVIAEVFTAHSGKWNLFDSFKEQRESVNFYNKNTIVLEEIVKQIERDEKLGQDLMSKRVEKEKKKNIVEAGPDAENFKKWREENSELKKLGAKYIGDMADEDAPENSVQVDVWKIAKGGLEIVKDKFFSQAEQPTAVSESK
jgi:hypothetical protein